MHDQQFIPVSFNNRSSTVMLPMFTNVGDYRHDVPATSARRLDDLTYAEFMIQQSNINIDIKYRDHFMVNYVYGFQEVPPGRRGGLRDEAGKDLRSELR
uniref:Uncharacterized protein n=1 Tax=Anopheles atroparvus TaxID=41427 RepID=A0AAG5DQB8_ANOAO